MKINALVKHWEDTASGQLTSKEYHLRLPIEDAARVAALAEKYPKRTPEELISDLLSAALAELESGFPYVRGSRVLAEDELGDPMYEDVGPTPRFLDLSKKYLALLKREQQAANN